MENFLVHYDAITGEILGHYLKSVHGDKIPTPYIEITPEKHYLYINNNGKYRINPTTKKEELAPPPKPDPKLYALGQLSDLDLVLPKCVEDLIDVLGVDKTKLPKEMQDRLAKKKDLRLQLKNL